MYSVLGQLQVSGKRIKSNYRCYRLALKRQFKLICGKFRNLLVNNNSNFEFSMMHPNYVGLMRRYTEL